MATRNGKANPITPRAGTASPRMVLFRNAGLASVWNWGDDAGTGEPTGTPIASDIDCVIGVTAEASFLADSAFAVNGACLVTADTGVVTTRAIGVFLDQRLAIYEVTAFARDCDLQAVALNARNVLADQRVAVSNSLLRDLDVRAEIAASLAEQFDLSLRSHGLRTVHGDVLISVPNPMLLAADTSVAVSRTISTEGDQSIAVSGSVERLADCLQSIWGRIEQSTDLRIVAGERTNLETDQAWLIGNTHVSDCDAAAVIACLMALASDVEIRTTTRLVPDADTRQTVFAVILRESHIIEV
ncbi:MAG: hypothetical protein HYX78_05060 [Armatimonadetes bacterium]|nr:hypothetical protein [Armatimonadota bacterium]